MENLFTKKSHQQTTDEVAEKICKEKYAVAQQGIFELYNKRDQLILNHAPINEIMFIAAEIGRKTLDCSFREKLDYSPEGLSKISLYISKVPDIPQDIKESMVVIIGAFVGEILIKEFDGKWVDAGLLYGKEDSQIGSVIIGEIGTNPFLRVSRQLERGAASQITDYTKGLQQLISNGHLSEGYLLDVGEVWHLDL